MAAGTQEALTTLCLCALLHMYGLCSLVSYFTGNATHCVYGYATSHSSPSGPSYLSFLQVLGALCTSCVPFCLFHSGMTLCYHDTWSVPSVAHSSSLNDWDSQVQA